MSQTPGLTSSGCSWVLAKQLQVGWVFGVQIWGSRVVELWRSVVCSLDSSGLGR